MCMVCVLERKCMPGVRVKHLPLVEHASAQLCSAGGCSSAVTARGWCAKHYQRWRRHGDPSVSLKPRLEA